MTRSVHLIKLIRYTHGQPDDLAPVECNGCDWTGISRDWIAHRASRGETKQTGNGYALAGYKGGDWAGMRK